MEPQAPYRRDIRTVCHSDPNPHPPTGQNAPHIPDFDGRDALKRIGFSGEKQTEFI